MAGNPSGSDISTETDPNVNSYDHNSANEPEVQSAYTPPTGRGNWFRNIPNQRPVMFPPPSTGRGNWFRNIPNQGPVVFPPPSTEGGNWFTSTITNQRPDQFPSPAPLWGFFNHPLQQDFFYPPPRPLNWFSSSQPWPLSQISPYQPWPLSQIPPYQATAPNINFNTVVYVNPPQPRPQRPRRLPRVASPEEVAARRVRKDRIRSLVHASPDWEVYTKKRQGGKFEGRYDMYFYSKVHDKRFRSLKEIEEFLETERIHKEKITEDQIHQQGSMSSCVPIASSPMQTDQPEFSHPLIEWHPVPVLPGNDHFRPHQPNNPIIIREPLNQPNQFSLPPIEWNPVPVLPGNDQFRPHRPNHPVIIREPMDQPAGCPPVTPVLSKKGKEKVIDNSSSPIRIPVVPIKIPGEGPSSPKSSDKEVGEPSVPGPDNQPEPNLVQEPGLISTLDPKPSAEEPSNEYNIFNLPDLVDIDPSYFP
ncbi:hypothetical protein NE237_025862 [Protea cynaroides]|uniref:MBD domain-containing protein n=1 Tax=Protea cynaroides TaxID=273540 RepID=A0A9Q0H512_9MAGN|nr:hypothetical protein NE237_025862 [Protea cynaroides]